jgi:hypothetical protein
MEDGNLCPGFQRTIPYPLRKLPQNSGTDNGFLLVAQPRIREDASQIVPAIENQPVYIIIDY